MNSWRAPKPYKLDAEKRSEVEKTIQDIDDTIAGLVTEVKALSVDDRIALQRSWQSMFARIDLSSDNPVGPAITIADVRDFRRLQTEPTLREIFDIIQESQTVSPDALNQSLTMREEEIARWVEAHDIRELLHTNPALPRALSHVLRPHTPAFEKIKPFLKMPLKRWRVHVSDSPGGSYVAHVVGEIERTLSHEISADDFPAILGLHGAVGHVDALRDAGVLEELKIRHQKEFTRLIELFSSESARRSISAYSSEAIGNMRREARNPSDKAENIRHVVRVAVRIAAVRELLRTAL